jgi:hypothetical protein
LATRDGGDFSVLYYWVAVVGFRSSFLQASTLSNMLFNNMNMLFSNMLLSNDNIHNDTLSYFAGRIDGRSKIVRRKLLRAWLMAALAPVGRVQCLELTLTIHIKPKVFTKPYAFLARPRRVLRKTY